MSQFLHGQQTHPTCHHWPCFGWIGGYDSVFQFLPISSNLAQPLKRSGPETQRENPQPTRPYTKEMCCTVTPCGANGAHTRCWPTHPPIQENWPFIVGSPRRTFHGWMEKCGFRQICQQYLREMGRFNVYIEEILRSLSSAYEKGANLKVFLYLLCFHEWGIGYICWIQRVWMQLCSTGPTWV